MSICRFAVPVSSAPREDLKYFLGACGVAETRLNKLPP
jgi:hypothetical protein